MWSYITWSMSCKTVYICDKNAIFFKTIDIGACEGRLKNTDSRSIVPPSKEMKKEQQTRGF